MFVYGASLSAYICPSPVTIGVYLSNACHNRRIFVQCLSPIGVYLSNACHCRRIFGQYLSLPAHICPMPVTIDVYLSNACHYRRIFVQCLSLSAYICPMPVTIGVCLSNACHYRPIFVQCLSEVTENVAIPHAFQRFGTYPQNFQEGAICYSSGPPQHAPGVRMT